MACSRTRKRLYFIIVVYTYVYTIYYIHVYSGVVVVLFWGGDRITRRVKAFWGFNSTNTDILFFLNLYIAIFQLYAILKI